MTLCHCNHEKEEHNERCSGIAEDQGVNIGCYCPGFVEQTEEWLQINREARFRELERNWEKESLFYKLRKFLGL